jgi:hypothetical protein
MTLIHRAKTDSQSISADRNSKTFWSEIAKFWEKNTELAQKTSEASLAIEMLEAESPIFPQRMQKCFFEIDADRIRSASINHFVLTNNDFLNFWTGF